MRAPTIDAAPPAHDRSHAILDAALTLLARDGIGGVTMRAVAHAAGVSLGLAAYYYTDKPTLVAAALRRIGEDDLAILHGGLPAGHELAAEDGIGGGAAGPRDALRRALRRVADERYLHRDYLALRLQLWSLAAVDPAYERINREAQRSYLRALTTLVRAAVPALDTREAAQRAGDVLVVQNGIWLTAAILGDRAAVARGVARCEQFALAPAPRTRTRPEPSGAARRTLTAPATAPRAAPTGRGRAAAAPDTTTPNITTPASAPRRAR